MVTLPAVDLFCGAGGLSLGLRDAGFTPVYALDSDRHAAETYRRNLGAHVRCAPASEVTPEVICQVTGVAPGEFALVAGGPPCQGFSVQRRGTRDDPRNDLVVQYARLATALRPAFILIENVPGLLGRRGAAEFKRAAAVFKAAGYRHAARVLDAADYGVPQHRRRAIVIAWRADGSGFTFPAATHGEDTWRTVRDALGDLPEPPDDGAEHPDFPNHRKVKVSPLNERRIAHVPPGGGRADLPRELQLDCHRADNGHRHLDVYGRMEWDKPAPTITAMFDNFTRGRFAHPVRNRSVTGREGARLQSFPDTFVFTGPKKDVARQIGNAVPPLLARRVGEAIRRAMEGRPADAGLDGLPLFAPRGTHGDDVSSMRELGSPP